jgi:hypothetical protein
MESLVLAPLLAQLLGPVGFLVVVGVVIGGLLIGKLIPGKDPVEAVAKAAHAALLSKEAVEQAVNHILSGSGIPTPTRVFIADTLAEFASKAPEFLSLDDPVKADAVAIKFSTLKPRLPQQVLPGIPDNMAKDPMAKKEVMSTLLRVSGAQDELTAVTADVILQRNIKHPWNKGSLEALRANRRII